MVYITVPHFYLTFYCLFCYDEMPICKLYSSISTNDLIIKSDISGVIWQVAPESKIQLVSCDMSPHYILGISALKDIRAIDAYIFIDWLWSVLFFEVLSIFVNMYAQVLGFYLFHWNLLFEMSCFEQLAIKWSSDPHLKHILGF